MCFYQYHFKKNEWDGGMLSFKNISTTPYKRQVNGIVASSIMDSMKTKTLPYYHHFLVNCTIVTTK
jgi:hypothetical protein